MIMVRIDWGNADETFLVWRFEGGWQADDYVASVYEANRLADSKAYPVDIILDLQRSNMEVADIARLFRWGRDKLSENICLIIVVTTNPYWQNLFDLIGQVYGTHRLPTAYCTTSDGAYDAIEAAQRARGTWVDDDDDDDDG